MSAPKPNSDWYKASDGNIYTSDGLYVLESGAWVPRLPVAGPSNSSSNSGTIQFNSNEPLFRITGQPTYPYPKLGASARAAADKDPLSRAFVAAWDAVAGPNPNKE